MPIIFLFIVLMAIVFSSWTFAFVAFGVIIGLRLLMEAAKAADRAKASSAAAGSKKSSKSVRAPQIQHIRNRLPSSEPIRANLIDVVEEALALKNVITRAQTYDFAIENFGATLVPDEFQTKSDQAIDVATDLADRFDLIARSTKGRIRSDRTLEAIAAQQQKMDHLKEALEYSRSSIEVLILTKGEGEQTTAKLARSLSNLSDALDESWSDDFDQLETSSSPARLAPQAESA